VSTAGASLTAARDLAAITGNKEAHFCEDPAELEKYSIDGVVPGCAVSPGSAEEVAAVLRLAGERDLVVVPAGGFTRQSTGRTPSRVDVILRTGRLGKLEHYDPGDLTMGIGAGATLAEVEQTLRAHAQFLPLDPARAESATVGGALATAAQGPLKAGYGGVRDYCIGVGFVSGDGKVAKAGGRVVKNVAGYDLMKLLIGSYGTLGILVSANFKVLPQPRQTRTYVLDFASLPEASAFRRTMASSSLAPMCFELASPRAEEYLCDPPPARDPDEAAPQGPAPPPSQRWRLYLRAGGSDRVLARYRRELGSVVSAELGGEHESQLWRWLSNFEEKVAARHRNAMFLQLSLAISDVPPALEAAERIGLDHNLLCAIIGRFSLGAMFLALVPLAVDPPSAMQYANAASALRGALPPGSSAVVTRCPKEAKAYFDVWGSTPTDVAMMQRIKHALDPKNILNRDRFLV